MTPSPYLTVAVHGVSGPQGSTVARALVAAGHSVRGLARKVSDVPSGVVPCAADLSDVGSLVRAYAGADAVFVHLPTVFDRDRVLGQADAILAALGRAEVPRVVFNPNLVPPPVEVGLAYLDARTRVAQGLWSGASTSSVVAPAAQYMENLNAPWSAPLVLDDGVLAYPLPAEAPVPWVALDDIATAVVDSLHDAAPPPITVVTGPEALTGAQVAAELTESLGRPVHWRTISGEEYTQMLAPHMGEEAAGGIGALYASILSGEAPPPPPLDPAITRAGATTVRAWAAAQPWPYRTGADSTTAAHGASTTGQEVTL